MTILTHGSDLTLAPTIRAVVAQSGGTVRAALDGLVERGCRAVQLDATMPGIRPRDLDQRARRDLSAMLTRKGVTLAGLDVFIPRRHFVETEHLDRAMTAATSAIVLAADLGRVPVSLSLPVKTMSSDSRKALVECADGHGVRLAIHCEDQLDALLEWVNAVDLPALGVALDPAVALSRRLDPVAMVHKAAKRLLVARLADVAGVDDDGSELGDASGGVGGGHRCPVGQGELDTLSYRIALDLAPGRTGPVVLDLRGLTAPLAATQSALATWDAAAFKA